MHYHCEIYVSEINNIEDQIEEIMEPFQEEYHEEKDEMSGFWDWWQIGGRWTGAHSDKYDPQKDERNLEECWVCNGTGLRIDDVGIQAREEDPSYTCNGCGDYNQKMKRWEFGEYGKGITLKWPTQWAEAYEIDVMPLDRVKEDFTCHTLIANGNAYQKEKWDGDNWVKTEFDGNVKNMLEKLKIDKGFLVTVDYHC